MGGRPATSRLPPSMQTKLFAIDVSEDMESPIYGFNEKELRLVAARVNNCGGRMSHIANVTIGRDTSFSYTNIRPL